MNQTQKRLSIIKLAISITDIETIQLQVLKLSPIKTDDKIKEILALLQSGNYAQAQSLITAYIDSNPDAILQRTSQEDIATISEEDQATIDEFNLFVTPTTQETKHTEIDINEYAPIDIKITKDNHTANYNALLNLEADDILQDNIDIDITHKESHSEDGFFQKTDTALPLEEQNDIVQDTFFEDCSQENDGDFSHHNTQKQSLSLKEDKSTLEEYSHQQHEEESTPVHYQAMPHIAQKFVDMKKRYPLIQTHYDSFDTLDALLEKIEHEGYTEDEIEEMIEYIQKLVEKNNYTQAAQLLLLCAATESRFAKFMLARELYKGSILERNISEAFALMNTLALEEYPEALCDLGQFYEHGIGTSTNRAKAEKLYKEALDSGIKRAKKHYARLKKHTRGFLKV